MKLHPIKVGTRHFDERPVTATDPCYDSDTWCVVRDINIKPGDYECVAWKGREYYKDFDGKRRSCQRVFVCGIYLDGNIPSENCGEKIGELGVDAGLAGFFQDKPDYNDDAWFELCDKVHNHDYLILDEGFFTSSGYGDGCYPVYAYKNDEGEIVALEIRFEWVLEEEE